MVHKSGEKESASGGVFSVWRLSDLETMQQTITLLLFRDAQGDLYFHTETALRSPLIVLPTHAHSPTRTECRDARAAQARVGYSPPRCDRQGGPRRGLRRRRRPAPVRERERELAGDSSTFVASDRRPPPTAHRPLPLVSPFTISSSRWARPWTSASAGASGRTG